MSFAKSGSSRVIGFRPSSAVLVAESLEGRRLFCALHTGDGENTLAPTSEAIQAALARTTPKTPITDHAASWYKPARTVTIKDARTAKPAGRSVVARAAYDVPVTFSTNAAGLPLLTSRSDGAGLKVFLDFDGYNTDIPFDMTVAQGGDGNGATFNGMEQRVIYNAWRDIVSYYAMLNVNVTTVQPATGGTNPAFVWQRITDSVSGGAAYVGAINNNSSNGWTDDNNAITRTSGIAHEIAHQLNLQHQADFNNDATLRNEYSSGYVAHGPIIGIDYAQSVHKWFVGRNSTAADAIQDDLAKMTAYMLTKGSYGDGYRPDDFAGTTFASATPLTLSNGSFQTSGIIERNADSDLFSFTSDGTPFDLNVEPMFESALAAKLEIYDADGTLLTARDDTSYRTSLNSYADNAALDLNLSLPAGTYYAKVSGHGDYGDQGEYAFFASPLPTNWASQDLTTTGVGRGGYVAYDAATGTFAQGGGGAGATSSTDGLRFTYQPLLGNATVTARVLGLTNSNNGLTQLPVSGLMLRETLAANARFAAVGFRTTGTVYSARATAGGTATTTAAATPLNAPNWLRLARSGAIVTVQQSTDGVNFTTVGTIGLSSLAQTAYVGFYTTSANTKQLSHASFDNVTVDGTVSPPATPTPNALPAPTGLTAAPVAAQATGMTLTWADTTDAESGYAIERSVDGLTWTQIAAAAANATTYTDNVAFGAMRWWYRVAALSGATKSVYSNVATTVNKPAAPTVPQAIAIGTNKLSLTWRDVSGDTGYRIERSADDGLTYALVTTTAANISAYNHTGLPAGTTYRYRVTPLSAAGDGVPLTFAASTLLPAVSTLAFTNKTAGSVGLSWADIAGETGYRVERSTDNLNWATAGTTAAGVTIFTDAAALSPLTHYYYRVLGTAGGTQSAYGNTVFFATPAVAAVAAPWANADLGSVGGSGAASLDGTNATLLGSGSASITYNADAGHYLYRPMTGDGEIVVRVASVEAVNTSCRAGLMIREALTANAKSVAVYNSASAAVGVQMAARPAAGGYATLTQGPLSMAYPYLRLVRSGSTFTTYCSPSGASGSWTLVGTATVAMNATVYVGMTTTSVTNNASAKASFTNLSTVAATPPTVSSFVINDGAAQRSRVTSLGLTFDGPVNVAAGALTLWRRATSTGTFTQVTGFTLTPTTGGSAYTMTFPAGAFAGRSLVDGLYELRIAASGVTGTTGAAMTADSVYAFHRLAGDSDGNRAVNFADFVALQSAFGTHAADAGYLSGMDVSDDGTIDFADFVALQSNFGVIV